MNRLSRRDFIKQMRALGALSAVGALGFPVITRAQSSGQVVIIGGGFGGATCAKYLRRSGPALGITLIEPKDKYVTCPFSNTVLAGINKMDFITHSYSDLAGKYQVNIVHDTAAAIDTAGKKLTTKSGQTLNYDHLVVSPGIDFRWDEIEGYDEAASEKIPHAWQAGPQTELLYKQIEAMNDGGVVVITTPPGVFRAPSAPYERASMVAFYLKEHKPKSKVLILDSGGTFEEHDLFMQAWEELFPGVIEWVKNSQVVKADAGAMTVSTKGGDTHKGDVINIIPPQKAGAIANVAGLTDESGWCPVNQRTFESTKQKAIYIIGDACIAGDMPKAGSAANTQAKACAAAIVSSFTGKAMPEPVFMSIFYSLIGDQYAISDARLYRVTDGQIRKVSGGLSAMKAPEKVRRKEMEHAKGWYKAITSDAFN